MCQIIQRLCPECDHVFGADEEWNDEYGICIYCLGELNEEIKDTTTSENGEEGRT